MSNPRREASVMHLDLDAFFASVEQRDKPSLRGKPVIVGGVGGRGVVATASYEARKFGVRSAMSTREARSRCPHAAYLAGRFDAYREASNVVMGILRDVSPLVEPLSLDEAFVDLAAAPANGRFGPCDLSVPAVRDLAHRIRTAITAETDGLTASVGIATSKFMAKVASELDKPDGLTIVAPGSELALLRPMPVKVIPGVGPATTERLRRAGIHIVADLEAVSEPELIRLVGNAHGKGLYKLARAEDDRAVLAERETKSVSVEGTYETDLTDPQLMSAIVSKQAGEVAARLRKQNLTGRTVTIKARRYDFTTLNRSTTLDAPTDRGSVIARAARNLLAEVDVSGGIRLLGVGVSGMTDWVQDGLFGDEEPDDDSTVRVDPGPLLPTRTWPPGADVHHRELGRGWVWGSGRGVVTVRFETRETPPGPVRSFAETDPDLNRWPLATSEGEPSRPDS